MVSFTPAPSGEDGRSDLLSIAKRFGEPLYTLFLPSKVSSGPPGPGSEDPGSERFRPDRRQGPVLTSSGSGPGLCGDEAVG